MQRSILHQNGGHGAAAAIELGLEHRTHGLAAWRCLGRLDVADQADHFQQQIEILALLCRNLDEDRALLARSGPLLGNQTAIGELLFHPLDIGLGFIDLVYGHDDRNIGGLGVIDGLDRLRHHAVVGGHHDHYNIGDLGAAGAHARKCLVTRRIQEDDLATVRRRAFFGELHLVGADVLGNASSLAGNHVGLANRVQQRGLAMVHVAHDGDHRRTRQFDHVGVIGVEHILDRLVLQRLFVGDDL